MLVCMSVLAVVSGTGMVMTTLSAKSLLLKPAFTLVFTSIRVRPSSVIKGVTYKPLNTQCLPATGQSIPVAAAWTFLPFELTCRAVLAPKFIW